MSFIDNVRDTLVDTSTVYSENGALMQRTTGKDILDFFFQLSSFRNAEVSTIIDAWKKAYYEDPNIAVRLLFYIRDCRGGVGERRTFRICFNQLTFDNPELASYLIHQIPVYGRWDDFLEVIYTHDKDCQLVNEAIKILKVAIEQDLVNLRENKSVSLLAKWMPSENTTSKKSQTRAKLIRTLLGLSPREYRQTLSKLRKCIKLTESAMCANEWDKIDYSGVPSKAALTYKNAFRKHDGVRYQDYLDALANGDKTVKINAGTLFPYEIVSKYTEYMGWQQKLRNYCDETLEQLWKALPVSDSLKNHKIICVADGSGSMTEKISGNTTALDVANSIAILLSENLTGDYANKYITFSSRPEFVDMSNCNSLHDKIGNALAHDEVSNTNIEGVFDLILETAIKSNAKQEDIPDILVVSDMEFDMAKTTSSSEQDEILFKTIAKKFEAAGYILPKLIFWNVNSRTKGIPVSRNANGVILVSGFSQSIFDMVASSEIDPYQALLKQLNNSRYDIIQKIINEINNK